MRVNADGYALADSSGLLLGDECSCCDGVELWTILCPCTYEGCFPDHPVLYIAPSGVTCLATGAPYAGSGIRDGGWCYYRSGRIREELIPPGAKKITDRAVECLPGAFEAVCQQAPCANPPGGDCNCACNDLCVSTKPDPTTPSGVRMDCCLGTGFTVAVDDLERHESGFIEINSGPGGSTCASDIGPFCAIQTTTKKGTLESGEGNCIASGTVHVVTTSSSCVNGGEPSNAESDEQMSEEVPTTAPLVNTDWIYESGPDTVQGQLIYVRKKLREVKTCTVRYKLETEEIREVGAYNPDQTLKCIAFRNASVRTSRVFNGRGTGCCAYCRRIIAGLPGAGRSGGDCPPAAVVDDAEAEGARGAGAIRPHEMNEAAMARLSPEAAFGCRGCGG